MTNSSFDTSLFDRAAVFAINAHSGIERRGKGFPYIIHPFEAAAIVATITNDPEMLAAAVLHDTVEDTGVTNEQIESEFGPRVARLVFHETAPHGFLPWREKRLIQIEKLRNAPRDGKIVAIGDKLSNLRAISSDYSMIGDELWKRFHAPNGKTDIEWYYRGLADALSDLSDTVPYQEFLLLLDKTFTPQQTNP